MLDRDELVSTITSSVDVDTAKPHPEILGVALDRAGVDTDRAVFVGDTVWDATACLRIELASIGVLSGGIFRDEHKTSSVKQVFENPEDLLAHRQETPITDLVSEPGFDGGEASARF